MEQARRAIRWEIILVIAASLGVSTGMETSGASAAIANGLISIGRNAGGSGFIIVAIYLGEWGRVMQAGETPLQLAAAALAMRRDRSLTRAPRLTDPQPP